MAIPFIKLGKIAQALALGGVYVKLKVITALNTALAENLALMTDGLFQHLAKHRKDLFVVGISYKKIKACTASHRAKVDYIAAEAR